MVVPPTLTSQSPVTVFDRKIVQMRRKRCLETFQKYDFLHDWAGQQIIERLDDIKRTYPNALVMGVRQGAGFFDALTRSEKSDHIFTMDLLHNPKMQNNTAYLCADEEFLPVKPASLHLVLSTLNLHSANDLPGSLIQIRQALAPDGLFVGALLGGQSLMELRSCLSDAEIAVKGGISPRIAPFADKQDMGALMQRAGFALPVIDSDTVSVSYDNAFKLFADLRGMGESNALSERVRHFSSRAVFLEAARLYQERYAEPDGRIIASFEIIFLIGWAPHSSQQKPLKPGSGKTHLSEVL